MSANGAPIDENTIEAFSRAIEVGAHYIESDIQTTRDGIAVLFHDDAISDSPGSLSKIGDLTLEELQSIPLPHGGQVSTLESVLAEFPGVRFNLDFKSVSAIGAGTKAILTCGAQSRVMVASFSDARRQAAAAKLPGVASSGGSSKVLASVLAHLTKVDIAAGIALTGLQALQIPVSIGKINLASEGFIRRLHKHQVEAHYWTINDPEEMQRLVAAGADGIVTDRADLAVQLFS